MAVKPPIIPVYPVVPAHGDIDRQWANELIRQLELRDRNAFADLKFYTLSGTVAIDSTGVKTVSINYHFDFVPKASQCMVGAVAETAVTDHKFDSLRMDSISQTATVLSCNVTTGSATGGATMRLVAWVRPWADLT